MPIVEMGDPLVDVGWRGSLAVATKRESENEWYRLVRSRVLDRLLEADSNLPGRLRLCLEEGYRPRHIQRRIFEAYLQRLRDERAPLSDELLRQEATKYVAVPDGAPPHSTGGAVDVTLVGPDGDEVDMGSSSDDTPLDNDRSNYSQWRGASPAAKRNRRTLRVVMEQAGFVNYPAEWWHWSYGDQYWAYRSRRRRALYGVVDQAASDLYAAAVTIADTRRVS